MGEGDQKKVFHREGVIEIGDISLDKRWVVGYLVTLGDVRRDTIG